MSGDQNDDKRAEPRYEVGAPVRVTLPGWPEPQLLQASDISVHGIFLEMIDPPRVGTEVVVGPDDVALRGRVAFVLAAREATMLGRKPGVGIRLDREIDPDGFLLLCAEENAATRSGTETEPVDDVQAALDATFGDALEEVDDFVPLGDDEGDGAPATNDNDAPPAHETPSAHPPPTADEALDLMPSDEPSTTSIEPAPPAQTSPAADAHEPSTTSIERAPPAPPSAQSLPTADERLELMTVSEEPSTTSIEPAAPPPPDRRATRAPSLAHATPATHDAFASTSAHVVANNVVASAPTAKVNPFAELDAAADRAAAEANAKATANAEADARARAKLIARPAVGEALEVSIDTDAPRETRADVQAPPSPGIRPAAKVHSATAALAAATRAARRTKTAGATKMEVNDAVIVDGIPGQSVFVQAFNDAGLKTFVAMHGFEAFVLCLRRRPVLCVVPAEDRHLPGHLLIADLRRRPELNVTAFALFDRSNAPNPAAARVITFRAAPTEVAQTRRVVDAAIGDQRAAERSRGIEEARTLANEVADLARRLDELGAPELAMQGMRYASVVAPTVSAHKLSLARLLLWSPDGRMRDEGADIVEAVLRQEPRSPSAHLVRAYAFDARGRKEEAKLALRRALQLEEAHAEANAAMQKLESGERLVVFRSGVSVPSPSEQAAQQRSKRPPE